MSWETTHNAVNSRFKTQVADTQSVATIYDNFPGDPPVDTIWVRWSVRQAVASQVSFSGASSGRFRHPGLAIAQIFVPVDSGTQDGIQLADIIKAAFRAVTVASVTYQTPYFTQVGVTDGWWQMNVSCPFYFDEVV